MHPITKRKLYCYNESPIVKTKAEQSFCYAPKEESGCILSKRFSGRLLLRQWRRRKKERNIHNSGCICRFALEFCNYKKERTETLYQSFSPFMAEKPGFEPGRRLSHPTPLAGEPLRPLGYFSICIWRRERDSNPRCLSTSLVFKTSAINHSAISPCKPANMIISDAEEVVNIYTLFFCRNWQSFLRMALSEGKAPLPHR